MINGDVSPMSPLTVQSANLHAGPSESLTHHSQPCLQTGSAPSVLAARAIFVCLVFLVGRFVYFAADTLLLQYSDCLPEIHGLFLRLRRGRRSAAAPRCWPGAVAAAAPPDPPAASCPGPVRRSARLCPSAPGACLDPLLARSSLPVLRPLSAALPGCTVCLRVSTSAFLSLPAHAAWCAPDRRQRRAPAPPLAGSALAALSAAAPAAAQDPLAPAPLRCPPSPHPAPHTARDARPSVCAWGRSVCVCLSARPCAGGFPHADPSSHVVPPSSPPRQPILSQEHGDKAPERG
ncbi:transcription initiation factor TFIID subunit 4-like [Onychostruthus taczanowskii]|uniref:transcription initiation factor TFIID subunit 4-like n=1 Tax=Onychostruthus taczanowskii TaxID=356909 RepID=UPI001B80D039|nr:transcription initiation factor TFIID subunit 4-like [Onychostruthus taczanowskii]